MFAKIGVHWFKVHFSPLAAKNELGTTGPLHLPLEIGNTMQSAQGTGR
jgi:hypothetical protein